MGTAYNIYCDESCHLENDHQKAMVLGAVWCPRETARRIAQDIKGIKMKHGFHRKYEIKWAKVSPKKISFYKELIDYFFTNADLHFRALIVPDKSVLQYEKYGQDHDTFYYKMYFNLLKWILSPGNQYYIYLDIKDTRSAEKTRKLKEVLSNNELDFKREIIKDIQLVPSREVAQVQLADLLIGVISYVNRDLDKMENSSSAKVELVQQMKQRTGYQLTKSTLYQERKVNIFKWVPPEG